LIAAVLGSLIGVPIWSVLVLAERDHLWIGAVMLRLCDRRRAMALALRTS
jgi:hypothetical protein